MNYSNPQSGITNILIATTVHLCRCRRRCGAYLASRVSGAVKVIYVIDARRLAGHFMKTFRDYRWSRRMSLLIEFVILPIAWGNRWRGRAICHRRGVACRTQLETGNVVMISPALRQKAESVVMGCA